MTSKTEENQKSIIGVATAAVQAHEMLNILLTKDSNEYNSNKLLLDSSREVKSQLEGSFIEFNGIKPVLDESICEKLRQLTITNFPNSLSNQSKQKFVEYIHELFKEKVDKILYVCLISCPWYSSCVTDRNIESKFNKLFIVYRMKNEHFFSLMNRHDREKYDVCDMHWLYACDIFHFSHYLNSGKANYVETIDDLLIGIRSVLLSSDEFDNFLEKKINFACNKPFMNRCLSQAIGQIGKKKNGKFILKESSTLQMFCESFKLLYYVHCSLKRELIVKVKESKILCEDAEIALDLMIEMYKFQENLPVIDKLFNSLMNWHTLLNEDVLKTGSVDYSEILSDWLSMVRLTNCTLFPINICNQIENVETLLEKATAIQFSPRKVVMIAQAGSFLYNLCVKKSDEDYIIVYAEDCKTVSSNLKYWDECHECRGSNKLIEYGAYEIRLFAEMLWKCSVVILELLFTDNHEYDSEIWQWLSQHKKDFICEKAIRQYLGLIAKRLNHLERRRYSDEDKERKLFYQILHKLDACERMINNQVPNVRCSGQLRDLIMRIRLEPLEGEMSRENLMKLVTEKIETLKINLAKRTSRLPENPKFEILNEWILISRGLRKL